MEVPPPPGNSALKRQKDVHTLDKSQVVTLIQVEPVLTWVRAIQELHSSPCLGGTVFTWVNWDDHFLEISLVSKVRG